jgi:hypothetical protein
MSVDNLKTKFKANLVDAQKDWADNFMPNDETLVEFTLGGSNSYNDFIIGTSKIIKVLIQDNLFDSAAEYNTVAEWQKATLTVLNRYGTKKKIGNTLLKGVRETNSLPIQTGVYMNAPVASIKANDGLAIVLYGMGKSKGNSQIKGIYDSFTRDVWKQWVKNNKVKLRRFYGSALDNPDKAFKRPASSGTGTRNTTIIKTFRSSAKREHSLDTTTASQATRDLFTDALNESSPSITYNGIAIRQFDILKHIIENTTIDWNLQPTKDGVGKYETKNIVKLSLGKNPTNLASDLGSLMTHAENYITQHIKNSTQQVLSDVQLEASTSLNDQVGGDVITDILRPLTKVGLPDMRYKVNVAEFSTKRRKEKVIKPKGPGKAIMSAIAVSVSGKTPRPIAKEKKKEQDTGNLLKIEALINKKLPAQVRKNMGRPALINQTGRFSNSVEVQNLRATKSGLSGEYTYMLSPYETFENTGSIRWPSGYNPKPLIAKSIRELAMGLTSQKLVSLRRN